jgi:hypothetical protein
LHLLVFLLSQLISIDFDACSYRSSVSNFTPFSLCVTLQCICAHILFITSLYMYVVLQILGTLMYCGLFSRHFLFRFSVWLLHDIWSCCYYSTFSFRF